MMVAASKVAEALERMGLEICMGTTVNVAGSETTMPPGPETLTE